MSSPSPAAARSPPGRPSPEVGPHPHEVQFYETPAFLFDAAGRFLAAGLGDGRPAVVIATLEHRRGLLQALRAAGVEVARVLAEGRLRLLDARETLALFMVGGLPDRSRFLEVMGALLEELRRGRGETPIQAYGELVDVLWRDGLLQGGLQLEELWNELARAQRFSLLCAYSMGSFREAEQAPGFRQICSLHSTIAVPEACAGVRGSDAHLRELALLQQRACALESEIARREKAEEEVLEALRSRDDFIAIAGHELRTPLTALLLQVETLRGVTRGAGDPGVFRRVERVAQNAERLALVIEGLVEAARLRSGRPALQRVEYDLAPLVQEAVGAMEEAFAQGACELRLVAEAPVMASVDPERVRQVVGILLSNALKYGAGSPVEVWVRQGCHGPRIVVRDRGPGIPAEEQPRIFERFVRGPRRDLVPGLGMGLWIARSTVEAHGGVLRVESAPGQGASFIVELPASPSGAAGAP